MQRIFEACKKAKTPKPLVRYEPNDLWIEFPFAPEYLEIVRGGETTQETTQETSGKTSGKTARSMIAMIAKNGGVTIPEMAAVLGITERSVERNLKNLRTDGLVRRIGFAKGGYWEVIDKS